MAEALATGGWVTAGAVGAYLRQALPDGYFIVAEPVVGRCPLAAAVVGRGVLAVVTSLDEMNAQEEDAAPRDAAALRPLVLPAVQAFLTDEFPDLNPSVHHLEAALDWASEPAIWRVTAPGDLMDQPVADAILTLDASETAFADDETREALAVGLRDRRLTASQRARKPFVFRSGGLFRVGARAWTIREAVAHMDRKPGDGVHHLSNGTLAAWLKDEGALHLAELARGAASQPGANPRATLESFLIATGLVSRPRLIVTPKMVDLGYVVEGQRAARAVRLRKGRGRGYLFGDLSTSAPWLHVEPKQFVGTPAEAVVSAQTEALLIGPETPAAELLVASSAGADPLAVPVRVRVVAQPSWFNSWVLRPLAAMLPAALMGGLIGLLWSWVSLAPPKALTDLTGLAPGLLWLAIMGLVWAFFGLTRGVLQAPAWPIGYALGRWLLRAAGWSAGLAAIAILLVVLWGLGRGGHAIPFMTLAQAAAVGAAFGILPSMAGEVAAGNRASDAANVRGRTSRRRRWLLAGTAVLIVLAVLFAPRLLGSAISRLQSGAAGETAGVWIEERLDALDRAIQDFVDRQILRFYDAGAEAQPTRQAPAIRLPGWLTGEQ